MHNTSLSQPEHNTSAMAAPADAAFATTPRHGLSLSTDIRRQMARDIAALIQDSAEKTVTTNDLLEKGWTRSQVERHAYAASALIPDVLASYAPSDEADLEPKTTDSAAMQNEASRTAPTPGPAVAAGPFVPPVPNTEAALKYVLDRNEFTLTRIDNLIGQITEEAKMFRRTNGIIRTTLQNLNAANA